MPRIAPGVHPPTSAPELLFGRISGMGIERHAESLAQLYDIEFTQIDVGEMRMQLDYVAAPSCVLYRESYQTTTHAFGSLVPGKFAFAVPIHESETRWWGAVRAGNLTPTALSGELIDVFFSPEHAHFVAVVDQARLLRALHDSRMPGRAIRAVQAGRVNQLLELHGGTLRHLSGAFSRFLDGLGAGNLHASAERFEKLILGAALSLLDSSPARHTDTGSGTQLFRRAIERYEALEDYPNVTMLCTELHARPRTVEAAFKKCAGMGPHRFFLLRRLNRAREVLSRSDGEECTVTEVALRLGFTELGRFAVRYRDRFGESPSTTLRRRSKTVVAVPC